MTTIAEAVRGRYHFCPACLEPGLDNPMHYCPYHEKLRYWPPSHTKARPAAKRFTESPWL